jgi:hypothetical protein
MNDVSFKLVKNNSDFLTMKRPLRLTQVLFYLSENPNRWLYIQ